MSFSSSPNICGRQINYPHFGDVENINVQRGIIPPPGVDVLPSPCQSYYKNKDFSRASDDCKDCLYTAQSIDRNCPCQIDGNNWCEYAKCVEQEYKLHNKCKYPYYSLYNIDDIRDESYINPFTYKQLRFCRQ